jgi:protein TonB
MTDRCVKTLRLHEITCFMVSTWMWAKQARENLVTRSGRKNGDSVRIARTPMTRALLLSLFFHGVIIVAMISCFTGRPLRHQEMVTVFLTQDEPGAGASGRAGKSGGAASLRESKGASHRLTEKKKVQASSPRSLPLPPPTPVPVRESVKQKTTAPVETNAAPDTTHPSGQSLTPSPLVGGPGDVDGRGSSGVGDGMGASAGRGAGSGTVGGGSGPGFGTGMGSGPGTGQAAYLREHFLYIRDLIMKNLDYPSAARRMGWQGVVQITFVVLENGCAEHVRITKSSGHNLLDQAVVKAVQRVQPFPRPPAKAELTVPVVFRLEGGTG